MEDNKNDKKVLKCDDYEESSYVPIKKEDKKIGFMSRKYYAYAIAFFLIIAISFGVTYSFFFYRKEDSRQADITSGEVYVRIQEQAVNLTLNKMYPRTNEEARARNDNYIDFTVKAKNTSPTKEVSYSVIITNGENVQGKTRINPDYLLIDLQEKVGNEYTYVKDAVSLSSFSFSDIIPINTTSEMTKEYRLRVWVSDSLVISNSETNATYTQTEFNNLFASIHVEVNSHDKTYVPTAIDMIASNVDTETTIDFSQKSSSSNGEGLYILPGTENDTNPIYYYRGAINNNNVLFGGFCWQMVRTTDTGGIKMIYNGAPTINSSGNNISYDCGLTRNFQDNIIASTNLQESTGFYYADDYEIVNTEENGATYRLKSKVNPITRVAIANATDASTNIPTIAANYPYTCKGTTDTETCSILYKVDSYESRTWANVYTSADITIIGKSDFNSNSSSLSDVGYMSNTRYQYSSSDWTTNALFAREATWVTDHYELTDASVTSPDASHHYSCNATAGNATCTSLRYVYYLSGTTKYYITLTNGELIEDAIYKMTGNGSIETKQKNSGYVLNQNNSTIKGVIDTWFETNLTNVVDNTKTDYRSYLEDTIYCNDRSNKTESGSKETYEQSGWNPNKTGTSGNGVLTKRLYLGAVNRALNNWYSTSNVPTVNCPNESDRFTVSESNGNGALTYPVGLLTVDEIVMAGASGSLYTRNLTYYLSTGAYYWSLSPYGFNFNAAEFSLSNNGALDCTDVGSSYGVRPVVSLKSGIEFETGGDGTPTNPYIVKYE